MLPALLEASRVCGQCFCTILVTAAASAPSTLSMTLPSCQRHTECWNKVSLLARATACHESPVSILHVDSR